MKLELETELVTFPSEINEISVKDKRKCLNSGLGYVIYRNENDSFLILLENIKKHSDSDGWMDVLVTCNISIIKCLEAALQGCS